jgi:hypothetical protein
MLDIASPLALSKIRYRAKKRGLRILRDGCGCFSVICTRTEPPRPLVGLDHVPLWVIEQIILTPLPESPPRRKRVARPAPAPAVEEAAEAVHPAATSFASLIDHLTGRSAA